MYLLRDLARSGLTVLLTLHDRGHAAEFCDRLAILHEGRVVASGAPAEVIDEHLFADVFGIRARLTCHNDRPVLDVDGAL